MKEFHYLKRKCVTALEISLKVHFKFVLTIVSIFLHYNSDHKAFQIVVFWYVTLCSRVGNPTISEEHTASFFKVEIFNNISALIILTQKTKAVCFSKIHSCTSKASKSHNRKHVLLENPQNLNNTAFQRTFWHLRRLGPILCHVNGARLWIVN